MCAQMCLKQRKQVFPSRLSESTNSSCLHVVYYTVVCSTCRLAILLAADVALTLNPAGREVGVCPLSKRDFRSHRSLARSVAAPSPIAKLRATIWPLFRGPTSSGWEQGLSQTATEEREESVFDGIRRRADEPATAGPLAKLFLISWPNSEGTSSSTSASASPSAT